MTGFVFTNNIIPDNAWAVMGSGVSAGNGTLAIFYPGAIFVANVLIGSNASAYPAANFFPGSSGAVGFVNLAGGNYSLSASSPYKGKGTDGLDVGWNINGVPR